MTINLYKCFIASPSDTQNEREICDTVFAKLNKTIGNQLNFRIESKKWENDARPSFGDDGQAIINEQLLGDYDLFIGIMWNKFGTATPRAGSGTEEEFMHAYKRHINQEDVEILFYFNKENAETDSLDLEQVQKVRDFKIKVSDLGGLYNQFKGTNEFEENLYNHLYSYFVNKLSKKHGTEELKIESEKLKELALKESITQLLKNRFDEALCMFTGQPIFWIPPILSDTNDISKNSDENFNSKIDLYNIIENPKSTVIKSPPQFGLTCLSHYFIKEAWERNCTWVYLDAKKTKRNSISNCVKKELSNLNIPNNKIDCIILDSWVNTDHGANKLLKNICKEYKDIPIIVMQTIDDSKFITENNQEKIDRDFDVLHLLALPRTEIRNVVSAYNSKIHIGDENIVLNKVISDLDVLNIHRTPSNCLTLLKVSEKHFDESPVNRTKMLEMVLFVLFDLGELPTYKVKPDLKDCEYVLGRFCENLIKKNYYQFTREHFLAEINSFCKEKLIDLEVSVVFDILYANSIIMKTETEFSFRASYWIYYFGAKRMHSNKEFCDYIFNEKKYVSFPEIIEFYTGIDRNRSDALGFLTNDIKKTCQIVEDKLGLPKELNPFKLAEWKPSEESIIKMQAEISEDVQKSKLPESIKDQHADRDYNQLKPYNQSIQTIFEEYSLVVLMQKIKACSRALRNSDYADPDVKRKMLKEITRGWEQISKVLFALTPALATKGRADFAGQGFYLADNFGDTIEERMNRIFQANPTNVVGFFKDDLTSNKIGPLLFDSISSEENELIKHHLILLLIFTRPRNWKTEVEKYIISISKNSFYLFDIVNALRAKYHYAITDETESKNISYLLKMGYAKHEYGDKKPGLNKIRKIQLPKRDAENQ
jgi:hypothetical protein